MLIDLFERYEVNIVKVRGTRYVRLTDGYDNLVAAAQGNRARQAGYPLPRCREFFSM